MFVRMLHIWKIEFHEMKAESGAYVIHCDETRVFRPAIAMQSNWVGWVWAVWDNTK